MLLKPKLFILAAGLAASMTALAQTPKAVATAEVAQASLSPSVMVTGQVHSRFQSDITPGVGGRIDWIIEAGTQVTQGQILAKLDSLPLTLRKREMLAQIKRGRISASRLEKEYKRLSALAKTQVASQTQLDQTQADYELAKADIELWQAQLAQLEDQIARTQVKAPFDGVVTQRMQREGQDVDRSDALLRLINLDELEVRVFAPLAYSRYVKPGQTLTMFSGQGQEPMKVSAVIPVSDVRSQTFELRLQPDPNHPLQVGQLVSVAVPSDIARNQFVVPRDAIVLNRNGHYLFVVDEGKAIRKRVKLGQGQGTLIAVDADIHLSEQVVVRGADTLSDGENIKVLSAQEFTLSKATQASVTPKG